MSLGEPEQMSLATSFVCDKSESVLSVIERCLDNGLGACLIVDTDQRLIGRISLDDIGQALLDGAAIVDPTLGWHLTDAGTTVQRQRNDIVHDDVLQPVIDPSGHLTGIRIDRSTVPVQVAKPYLSLHQFRSMLDAFISCWISSKGSTHLGNGRWAEAFVASAERSGAWTSMQRRAPDESSNSQTGDATHCPATAGRWDWPRAGLSRTGFAKSFPNPVRSVG
jgi:hypothetical protein